MIKHCFLFIVIFGLAFSCAWAMGEGAAPAKPAAAVDFVLPDLAGENIRLADQKGKVVFLNFFASWCPPCRAEMPSLQSLYNKFKGRNFEMLVVSVDRDGAKLKSFVEKNKFTFKILRDPAGAAASQYGVVGIPATFIIDKQGKIVESAVGARDWSRWQP